MEPEIYAMRPVATARTPFSSTADIPHGLGARHDTVGRIEVLPDLETGLTDIEGFSHLYLIWVFHRSPGVELVGTPPCDDHPHGVFASRSPRRPNPIGLTVVRLERRAGNVLHVKGVDMLDGTPILDIKPYLSSVPGDELQRGWLADAEARRTKPPA